MKKVFSSAATVISLGLIIASCTIKNNDNLTPTYRNQSTGTGANPNIHVVTVTGTQTLTNPATQNSDLLVGSSIPGWTFEGLATNPNKFVAHLGSTIIEIRFNGPISVGAFALTSSAPNSGQAQMIVYQAPGQPSDVTWYSKSGSINVTPFGSTFKVTFSNIPCLQWNYLFPVVTVSGDMIC